MEDQNNINEEMTQGTAKQWFQDNLRIIISIIIVVAIAGGIYSYSNRTQTTTTDQSVQEQTTDQNNNDGSTSDQNGSKQTTVATSQETETSFVESAGKGDSLTTLARTALANYLEKNPDSALTAEHKIYVEDFLRKNIPSKRVFAGTSVEFSKDLIQKAITKSKTLNDKQLRNLHKYAVRVPSLS